MAKKCIICNKGIPDKQKTCSRKCSGLSGLKKLGAKPRYTKKQDENGNYLCSGCKQFLPSESYDKSTRHKTSGVRSRCRECEKLQRIKWHSKPDTHLLELVRKASKRNRNFSLSMDWAKETFKLQNGLCFYTGIPMTHGQGDGRVWTNASIDRMDNNIGYTLENCVLCCSGFNLMKTNLPLDGMEQLSRRFIQRVDEGLIII